MERASNYEKVTEMVKCYKCYKQNKQVLYLNLLVDKSDIELSIFMYESLKSLSLGRERYGSVLRAKDIPFCPSLTNLSLINLSISEEVLNGLSVAGRNGKLPYLKKLSF